MQELCFQKGINWNNLPPSQKRGRCIVKKRLSKEVLNSATGAYSTIERSIWEIDDEIPIFSQDKDYILKYV